MGFFTWFAVAALGFDFLLHCPSVRGGQEPSAFEPPGGSLLPSAPQPPSLRAGGAAGSSVIKRDKKSSVWLLRNFQPDSSSWPCPFNSERAGCCEPELPLPCLAPALSLLLQLCRSSRHRGTGAHPVPEPLDRCTRTRVCAFWGWWKLRRHSAAELCFCTVVFPK